ncbi:MAG TPA: condensation domain-containing protein [Terriglobales bacterium]|nr:condensation domain-containing protein [Terriglobales bacterium]
MLHGTQNFETKAATRAAQEKERLADLLLQTDGSEVFPASLAQQRLWFLDQLQGQTAAYNVHLGFWLRGPLDLFSLRASLQEIVNRHDSLRTAFRLEHHELQQVVARQIILSVPVHEVVNSQDPYAEAYRLAEREVESPFDLREAPLFRARVIRVTADDHVLLCTMPHLVTDSLSTQIMARELEAAYSAFSSGKPSPLIDLPIGYGDFSEWQRRWLGTEQVQQQLTYWKNQLSNAPPLLELPTDGSRPPEQTFQGASQTVQLPGPIITDIKQLATRWQTTPFMLLVAAFKILLYRYSGQPDLLVGVPVAGRNRVETEGIIGFFVNTLVLRDDLSGNPRFSELVRQVRETTLDAFSNADVPFEKVVEVVKPERNLSYNPIFQVMFSVIKAAVRSHTFGNLTAFPYVVTPKSSIFDLSMTLIEGVDEQWWVEIDYNTDLFQSKRVGRMVEDYFEVLQAIVANPEARILDLPVAGADPKRILGLSLPQPAARTQRRLSSSKIKSWRSGQFVARQELLLGIWKEVLETPDIGVRDNFFDVGGHSLLAARLVAEIERATGRKVPVSAIFRAPTIETLAELLVDDVPVTADPVSMKLGEGEATIPFFTVAIPGVDTTGYAQLAHRLSPLHSVHKLQATAPLISGRPLSDAELEALAREYLAAMRAIQPHGPYCLGSMCEGVLVAQKMVLHLEREGEEVAFVAILDTWVRENTQIRSLWALDYHVQRLRYWSSRPIDEQFATLRRALARKIRRRQNVSPSGWERVFWPGEGFEPPRLRAPVLLFKRPRQPYYYAPDPEMGWGARSLGGVEIVEIECGHFEMLREPHVSVVSKELMNRLQAIAPHDRASQLDLVNNNKLPTASESSGTWTGLAV